MSKDLPDTLGELMAFKAKSQMEGSYAAFENVVVYLDDQLLKLERKVERGKKWSAANEGDDPGIYYTVTLPIQIGQLKKLRTTFYRKANKSKKLLNLPKSK
jgi:hypothetical protein